VLSGDSTQGVSALVATSLRGMAWEYLLWTNQGCGILSLTLTTPRRTFSLTYFEVQNKPYTWKADRRVGGGYSTLRDDDLVAVYERRGTTSRRC